VISERIRVPPRYRLLEEVGQGGMAIVYRAHDASLKRDVAIKLLHDHLSAEPECKARLEREAQAVAKLKHDNILEIFDYSGSDADSAYIVTEFIDGQTLKVFLADHRVRHPEVAALIISELGTALSHAHGLGIIHRDVKPENVMIRKDGVLKLMDFGIAQVVDLQRMTVTGQLLGSPAYMAPELIEGKPLDFRTDVFAVGIMLYQLATGSLPFAGKNPHEVLRRIVEGKFPDPRTLNRRIWDGLSRTMSRALAHKPDDRYPSVERFTSDLRAQLADAGLTDIKGELRAFFTDPATYEAALPARLAAGLGATASEALRANKRAPAIECWNRVLAFDPKNVDVLAALGGLERRARGRKTALVAAAAAALGAGIWGLGHLAPPRPAKAPDVALPVVAVAKPTPPAGKPPAPVGAGVDGTDDERPPTHISRRLARVTEPPAGGGGGGEAPRTFTLGPTPQNVDVYLDGHKEFAYDTDHKTLTVPWGGNHVIEFRSPAGCCFVEKVEVGPDRPLPPDGVIARRLKWRPALLRIGTDPVATGKGTRILVRDPNRGAAGTLARSGEDVDVPFFADDEGSKEIEISVDTGESFTSERLTVRAGQRQAHVVKLKAAN
jgi:eukaryotic-like serine/threonine-protein kinase